MKKFLLAVAVAAVATMGIVSSASAGVERYQTQSMTITVEQPEGAYKQWDNVWTHTYTVTLNPCDGSFTGQGTLVGDLNGPVPGIETITGNLVGGNVSFSATRSSDGVKYAVNGPISETMTPIADALTGQAWDGSGAPIDVSPNSLEFRMSKTMGALSNYKSHGEYVAANGGGDDAAHSCIGMPIH